FVERLAAARLARFRVLTTKVVGRAFHVSRDIAQLRRRVGRRRVPGRRLRQLLSLLPKLGLLARQSFQLAPPLLLRQALQLLLTTQQLVLAASERLQLFSVVVRRCAAPSLWRLVVGLLQPLQFLVEERRDIVIAVVVAGATLRGLLPRNLPLLHERLRFE